MNAISDLTNWTDVGAVTDIPLRGARRVPTPEGDIAVFRTGDGRVFALRDQCPHKGGPLSQGIVHGHAVTCPLHNWNIALDTGEAMGADKGKGCAPVVPLRVQGGRILLASRRRAA
jgi:nitrite reductase (NADH) small subunit